jgi:hypothetical protein
MGDDPERRLVETIEPLGLTDRAERASGRPTGLDMHDPLHLMMTDISPKVRRQVRVHDVLGIADELDERVGVNARPTRSSTFGNRPSSFTSGVICRGVVRGSQRWT